MPLFLCGFGLVATSYQIEIEFLALRQATCYG